MLAALLAMPILWFAFDRLALIAASHRDDGVAVDAFGAWCVAHGTWAPLLAAPALVHGLAVLARGTRNAIVSIALHVTAMLMPAAVTMWCFVAMVAPLYQVREI